ncbi:hypothetical protein FKV25_15095 [Lysobacter aestuarii]|uniref:Uncharacterized protein n=1 Tax=Marilutibacter aestuarii TaxID=1706195 RepID=A0A507ZTC2_9GAMM|nr:hypothetical protein FKV25_15095 [Lysobacter aestuarii]
MRFAYCTAQGDALSRLGFQRAAARDGSQSKRGFNRRRMGRAKPNPSLGFGATTDGFRLRLYPSYGTIVSPIPNPQSPIPNPQSPIPNPPLKQTARGRRGG